MDWQLLLYMAGAGLMAWIAFRLVKNNRTAFSKENLNKTIGTFGLLTLLMMAVIAICVMILRQS